MIDTDFIVEHFSFTELWIFYAMGAFVSGGIGTLLGRLRGRPALGFFTGVLLGPLGWLFVLLMDEGGRKCPECISMVHPAARRCRHCGSELPLVAKHQTRRVI